MLKKHGTKADGLWFNDPSQVIDPTCIHIS